MPINKETIISVFDDKLTLMQWLKTINKALDEAVLTGVEIAKKGNATLSFKFTFEDGTFLETNDIVLQQGESVVNAFIQNGHLYLTLSNGTNLDAGNVKPVSNFSIDANQHLIVNYGDGTSQDLGAIFNGNVNINGNLTANSIIENMAGYSFTKRNSEQEWTPIYVGVVKNGNKLTIVIFGSLNYDSGTGYANIANIVVPASVATKLYPFTAGGISSVLANTKLECLDVDSLGAITDITALTQKFDALITFQLRNMTTLTANKTYLFRIEQTFLLSDNLAS